MAGEGWTLTLDTPKKFNDWSKRVQMAKSKNLIFSKENSDIRVTLTYACT
jgi:hypothetical protein